MPAIGAIDVGADVRHLDKTRDRAIYDVRFGSIAASQAHFSPRAGFGGKAAVGTSQPPHALSSRNRPEWADVLM